MTQQRIPFLVCFLLLAAGCGGGDGTPIEPVDPNAPPVVADKRPTSTNQNPVNPASVPPVTNENPAATATPGTTEPQGGSCVDVCNGLSTRGCATPEQGCEAACRPDPEDVCPRQSLDLIVCAAEIICPEDFEAELQQVRAHCPDQYDAYTTCLTNSPQN